MLIRHRVNRFLNRVFTTAHSLIIDGVFVPKRRNILAVVVNERGRILIPASNIVTDEGDKFYAQKAAGETTTYNFANLYLSTSAWDAGNPAKTSTTDNLASVISGSEKAPSAGYPKTNDTDADNTGAGVDIVTWAYSYAKTDFSATGIVSGAIAEAAVTSWGTNAGTDQIMTGFTITSFDKTSNDTLKFFVNHTMNGV